MRFAIIASPRTGSSHLTALLNSQPDVLCNGEICHPKKVYLNWPRHERPPGTLAKLAELRSADPKSFLDHIFQANFDRPHVGFKILRGQAKDVFNTVMEDHEIRKIILFRRNALANYSSKLIALETGKYALHKKEAEGGDQRRQLVDFDADHFAQYRRRYEAFYASIMSRLYSSGQVFHFMNYEEINNPHFFAVLLAFIGADAKHVVLKARHTKQNPSHIVSRFSNPDAAEAFLRENNLQHWIYEGEVSFTGGATEGPKRRRKSRRRKENSPEESSGLVVGEG